MLAFRHDEKHADLVERAQPHQGSPRTRSRRDVEIMALMTVQPMSSLEIFSDHEIKRENLALVSMSAEHQINAVVDCRLPALWTVVEKNIEFFPIATDVGQLVRNLIRVGGIVNSGDA